jgi:hypothetical protein
MPYYRISLKAAPGICNTIGGRADEKNARPAPVSRMSPARATA